MVLTEADLREIWEQGQKKSVTVPKGTVVTPMARDFLCSHGMSLCFESEEHRVMPRTTIPFESGRTVFVDARTGVHIQEKPENMTHLRGNLLISKTDPRIAFRGKLDSLSAEILMIQVSLDGYRQKNLSDDLEEIRSAVLTLLGAEVLERKLSPIKLLGMDSEKIRYVSHHVKEEFGVDHQMPDLSMGRTAVELNLLRTRIREAELIAADIFETSHPEYIELLNRLSSCVYILYCRQIAKQEKGKKW